MTTPPFEFEKALKELEEITSWFESNNTDLDAGIAKFERGMTLANDLKTHLASVENRVEKIRQRFTGTASAAAPATDDQPPLGEPPADQADLFS